MCTALTLNNKQKSLFGRNMDIETKFGQQIVIAPRNYYYKKTHQLEFKQNYSIIGMGFVYNDYPMFAEAANEFGLAMAGLYFPGSAFWFEPGQNKDINLEITPYEFIPFILSKFKTVKELKFYLDNNAIILVNVPISSQIPLTDLHFIVSDKYNESIVIEQTKNGFKYFDNPLGILTNNPSFDWHITNLSFYQNLDTIQKEKTNWSGLEISPHGQGFASVGIPGDWTPASRFIRTAFLKDNTELNLTNNELLCQFFHILNNVAMVKGTIKVLKNHIIHDDITLYQSCIDLNELIYYYKTYNNINLTKIKMFDYDLEDNNLIIFPFNDNLMID